MSDEFKFYVCTIIKVLEAVATKTASPIDDAVVRTLKALAQENLKMSDDLKFYTCIIINVLEAIAKKTASPIDDAVVRTLKALAQCEAGKVA